MTLTVSNSIIRNPRTCVFRQNHREGIKSLQALIEFCISLERECQKSDLGSTDRILSEMETLNYQISTIWTGLIKLAESLEALSFAGSLGWFDVFDDTPARGKEVLVRCYVDEHKAYYYVNATLTKQGWIDVFGFPLKYNPRLWRELP